MASIIAITKENEIYRMEALLILVIVIIFIIVINSKKKKTEDFFRSKALDFKSVSLPKYFFEEIYLQCIVSNNHQIEQKIAFIKNSFKSTVDCFDDYLNALSTFDSVKNHSLFFESKEKYDSYMSLEGIDEIISKEIICDLSFLATLKRQYSNFLSVAKLYYDTIHNHEKQTYMGLLLSSGNEKDRYFHKKALEMAEATYRDVAKMNWKEICVSYPKYNNENNRKKFLVMAYNNKEAFNSWKTFYFDSMLNVAIKLGLSAWMDKFPDFMKECEKHEIFHFIKDENAFNEYSSIHEITDFSSEEIKRILDLYEQGIITGIYSKNKDPKYK